MTKVKTTQRALLLSSICYLVTASTGAAVAIAAHLPARFAGMLHGQDVARDFVGINGTALSPPLALLLAQAVLTALALRRGRAGTVGVIGLTALGTAYTLGQVGEPIAAEAFTTATRDPGHAGLVAANLVCSAALVVFGALEWSGRRSSAQATGGRMETPSSESGRGTARAGGRE